MLQQRLLAAGLCLGAVGAQAADLDAIQALGGLGGQQAFRSFSEDLGAALSYKALSPAEPLGVTGFDIGIEATNTKLENPALFRAVGWNEDYLPVPKLHIQKGLPLNIDVGAFYSAISDYKLWGAELKYAIIEGNTALPAVALRGTYTKLSGVEQLDLDTAGLELSVSKGLAMATPYIGAGIVRVHSTPKGTAAAPIPAGAGLRDESFDLEKYFVGVNLNFALVNIGLEGDITGGATSYGVKLGLRF